MKPFYYQNDTLRVENLALQTIAETLGTPTYVYSKAAILENYQAYTQALGEHPGMICYAVKANDGLAVLNVLAKAGAGFDIVSVGELEKVLAAGGPADRVIFSGVGKQESEMRRALEVGIACFNIESIAEIDRLAAVAAEMGTRAPVSLRINPDVDAKTHPYISTGLKENKFGINIEDAEAAFQHAASFPSLNVVGIDCHIGSQLTDESPLLDACDRLLGLYDRLAELGIEIKHLDLGGGVGIQYQDETLISIESYLNTVKSRLGDRQLALMCEPGRSIVGNAGALLMTVEYLKPTAHKNFAIVDAAMNDNIRPALYGGWQRVVSLQESPSGTQQAWDIVGPVCESTDFLARDRELTLQPGDVLAMLSVGAYGFVMSSNYNARPRAAAVMVDGDQYQVIRQREKIADLWRDESIMDN